MRCKVCHSSVAHFDDEQMDCLSYHCLKCEVIFKDPSSHVSSELEQQQYAQHNNSLENSGYVQMFESFLEFVELKDSVQRVLDFGSGPTPVFATILRRRGLEVEIYDKYYATNPIEGVFDLIVSTEVFEHLDDPVGVLKRLKSHLGADARVAIMTQFHKGTKEFYLDWWYRRDPTHITFFTPKTFEILADTVNMRVVKCDLKKIVILGNKESV